MVIEDKTDLRPEEEETSTIISITGDSQNGSTDELDDGANSFKCLKSVHSQCLLLFVSALNLKPISIGALNPPHMWRVNEIFSTHCYFALFLPSCFLGTVTIENEIFVLLLSRIQLEEIAYFRLQHSAPWMLKILRL